jgi:hypothetical protein
MRTRAIIAIFAGIVFITLMSYPPKSYAEVSVSIGIGVPIPQVVVTAPPPVVIHEPPPVVVIPGTYVYFAPDVGVDIFFYHGYWYRPHHGHWYRARGYNGPWDNVEGGRVPHMVRNLPPDFRYSIRQHERIRHADLQRNWKTWEQKKHWDRGDHRQWDRPDYRHDARDVRDDRRWKDRQGRLGGGARPEEVREVRGDRDRGKWENDQGKPEGRGKHDR